MTKQTTTANPRDIEEVYNALMWEIEPELTTEILPDLEFLTENETEEERQLRFEWYAIAFEEFLNRYKDFVAACKHHLQHVSTSIRKIHEKASDEGDVSGLSYLEQSMKSQ